MVPVGQPVKLSITSKDVDHDWWVPSLGAEDRRHAGPAPTRPGSRRTRSARSGQCAEFCGIGHAGMPITVKVVSQADWNAYTASYKDK